MVNNSDWALGENKPKQTQSQLAPSTAVGVEKTKPIVGLLPEARSSKSEISRMGAK
jgi:hypothetical protein